MASLLWGNYSTRSVSGKIEEKFNMAVNLFYQMQVLFSKTKFNILLENEIIAGKT